MTIKKKKIFPEVTITVKDCLTLKEKTKNRLKILHPIEGRKRKEEEFNDDEEEGFHLLFQFHLKSKPIQKPFSDRIINPFYLLNTTSSTTNTTENEIKKEYQKSDPQRSLKFIQRQTQWFTKKNQIEDTSLYQIDTEEVLFHNYCH